MIIRVNLTEEERLMFVDHLKQSSIGKRYDYTRVIQLLINSSLFEVSKTVDREDRIICSHQIYKSLVHIKPEL